VVETDVGVEMSTTIGIYWTLLHTIDVLCTVKMTTQNFAVEKTMYWLLTPVSITYIVYLSPALAAPSLF